MTDPRASALAKLPGISFATLAATGETIAICRGERSYYRVESPRTADELNALYGVSKAQARAMLAGMLEGWDTARIDPEQYPDE